MSGVAHGSNVTVFTLACTSNQNDAPVPVTGVTGEKPGSCPSVASSPPGPVHSTDWEEAAAPGVERSPGCAIFPVD